jgi:hypothetical protein
MNRRDAIAELNEDALFLSEDFWDEALIGTAERCSAPTLAVYDYDLLVAVACKEHGWNEVEAMEYIDFNICGAWMGEGTPLILNKIVDYDEH